MNITWKEDHIELDNVPKHLRKCTGTRLGAILGLNPWKTPFEAWCEITKTYKEPFEDNKNTIAGKIIEPKIARYLKNEYLMDSLVTPSQVFGKDYFENTHGDFFPTNKVFGGMWDFLDTTTDGTVRGVIEAKTTTRAEDWLADIPEYYALQGALYAYLLGCDRVIMVVSLLDKVDLDDPENFICSVENTSAIEFCISERYPNWDALINQALKWWDDYVVTGISPPYDEKKDADILKALRTQALNPTTDIDEVLEETESLLNEIAVYEEGIKDKKDRLETLKGILKEYSVEQFKEDDDRTVISSNKYNFTTTKTYTKSIDKKLLEEHGLLQDYERITESYKFTISNRT